jgi:hypothetical protein
MPRPGQIRCFEVDMPRTQFAKRQLLHEARIDSTGVTFVAADFETEDWLARLIEAGFDPNQPAVFLWEGVIMYPAGRTGCSEKEAAKRWYWCGRRPTARDSRLILPREDLQNDSECFSRATAAPDHQSTCAPRCG